MLFTVLLISTLTSVAGLIGGFLLLWKENLVRRWSLGLVSFAAGTLLGAAFLDLLSEAFSESEKPASLLPYLLGGFLIFFLIEKFLLFHHHMHQSERVDNVHAPGASPQRLALRSLIIFGDAFHNFLDGVIIAATFAVSAPLGFISALAVFFHEIPQEIGNFSILLHSGMERKKVALWNILGALISPLGALVGFFALKSFENIQLPLIAIAAGGFIYIAGSDLIPEINHESRLRNIVGQVMLLFLGIAVIWVVGTVLPEGH